MQIDYDVYIREIHVKKLRVRANSRDEASRTAAAIHRAYPFIEAPGKWFLTDPDDWRVEEVWPDLDREIETLAPLPVTISLLEPAIF